MNYIHRSLQNGDKYSCTLSKFHNFDTLYVRIEDEVAKQLEEELHTALFEIYLDILAGTVSTGPELSTPVVVFDNMTVERGEVIARRGSTISILMVDTGILKTCNQDCVYPATKKLLRLHKLATCCSVRGITAPYDAELENLFKGDLTVHFIEQSNGVWDICPMSVGGFIGIRSLVFNNDVQLISPSAVLGESTYPVPDFCCWKDNPVPAYVRKVLTLPEVILSLDPEMWTFIGKRIEEIQKMEPLVKKTVGAACLAKHKKTYFRAEILKVLDGGWYMIAWIDSGLTGLVTADSLAKIPLDLKGIYPTAVNVIIEDLIGVKLNDAQEKTLHGLLDEALVFATIRKTDYDDGFKKNRTVVKIRVLQNLTDHTGVDIAEILGLPKHEMHRTCANTQAIFTREEAKYFWTQELPDKLTLCSVRVNKNYRLIILDKAVDNLTKEMDNFYGKESKKCSRLEPGYPVAVLTKSNHWRRGRITEVGKLIAVFLVDYGKYEHVKEDQLLDLTPYFGRKRVYRYCAYFPHLRTFPIRVLRRKLAGDVKLFVDNGEVHFLKNGIVVTKLYSRSG